MIRFAMGKIVITQGAIDALKGDGAEAAAFINRHGRGDWGEMGIDDTLLNNKSLITGGRLHSAYHTRSGVKLWIITESDRSVTTLLLPSEY